MTVAFVESDRVVFCDGKSLKEEERRDSEDQLKNVRCVWCSSQSAVFLECKKETIEDVLKTKTSDPAWFEEVIRETEKTVEANVYYTESTNLFPIIIQKPISLTPLFYILKKIAEEKFPKKRPKIVGRFYGRKNSFVFLRFSGGKIEKFERKELRKEEIERFIKAKEGEMDFFIVGITVSEPDFYKLVAQNYKHLLTRDTTFLNDELKEIFYDVDEEKILFKSLMFSGMFVLLGALLYLGGAFYSYNLTVKLKEKNAQAEKIERKILKEQQKKIFSYAKMHSINPASISLPFREQFLTQLKIEGNTGTAVFDIPTEILSPQEEKELIRKAERNKCRIRRLEKILRLTCPVRK